MMVDKQSIREIVRNEFIHQYILETGEYYVPVAISNRHVHLSSEHLSALFGSGYCLKRIKDLSQPGQFVCEEKVSLIGPKNSIEGVRVLGPVRNETQVEISKTDSFILGVKPAVRMSGDINNTPGIRLKGPKGEIDLDKGVIVSARHLHISPSEAALYGVNNGDVVRLIKTGERETVFGNVIVRSGTGHSLEAHIDTDEGNAAGISNGELVIMEKQGKNHGYR